MMDQPNVFLVVLLLLMFSSAVLTEVIVTPATTKEGNTAVIECTFSSSDPLNVLSWRRANEDGTAIGSPLVSSDTALLNGRYSLNLTINSGNLYISDIRKADAGNYVCNVVFTGGLIESSFAMLTTQYLDEPRITGPTTPVLEDRTTTLYCSTGGFPTPITYSWMKDGVMLDVESNDRLRGSMYNQNLTIDSVVANDTGEYSCVAQNDVFFDSERRTSTNFNLEVNYVKITTMEWISGRVTCRAEGNPTPDVTIEVDRSYGASGAGSATIDVPCDTTSTVQCVLDNGVNDEVTEEFNGCDDACTLNPCMNGGKCTVSSSDSGFDCQCTSGFKGDTCKDESGSNAGLIAGVVIAVIVVIILIIVVVFICIKGRNNYADGSNINYSAKPADVELNDKASRQPLKTGDEPKSALGVNKNLQKSNEMLFDAREDAKNGGKAVGVMI